MNGLLRADKKLIENAKTELAKLPFGRQALKLKAVIAVNDHPAKTVAAVSAPFVIGSYVTQGKKYQV